MNPLLIRADASPQIGTGHVMRCLALAQAWQAAGGAAHFALASATPAVQARLLDEKMSVHCLDIMPGSANDAAQMIILAQELEATWIVTDGYHFDANYQQTIKQAGLHLLFIDDYGHADHYYADLVLNQNICANKSLYMHHEPYTHLLLGTHYAMLRREFWPWRGRQREILPVARKVLVTLGGADPDNVTLKIILALQQVELDEMQVIIVAGGGNPHTTILESEIQNLKSKIQNVRLERSVSDMPALMAWADLAISAGGITCWELAFMGLPALLLALAENQRPLAAGLDTAGAALNLGYPTALAPTEITHALADLASAPEKRANMAKRGQALVDGNGAGRVAQQMQSQKLTLRTARPDDCRLIWEWANDPATRAVSFSPETIPWEAHVKWFTTKLSEANHLFYIALNAAGIPVGQIRYQIKGQEAVVSVSLAPSQRGRGYGSLIIRLASQHVFERTAVNLIHAYVKPENVVSACAFAKAGFAHSGTAEVCGQAAIDFVLVKDKQL